MSKQLSIWIFVFGLSTTAAATGTSLGSYNIDPSRITVSGFSSGAYAAVQMHVAFSATFAGAGIIAGGPYWCAQDDAMRAQTTCMVSPQSVQTSDLINKAKSLAQQGDLDPLENLSTAPVYIYASPSDSVVNPTNSDKLVEFYNAFLPNSQIRSEHSIKSAHGMPTLDQGNPCTSMMSPWILNCNYDAAGEVLKTLYGSLQSRGQAVASNLIQFSQADFGNSQTPLYPTAWVYVPSDCAAGAKCGLHVVLHGCLQTPDDIQDKFPTMSGYNEWAEANHLIVLYPQSARLGSSNPNGCWDWWGFTGQNYMTKKGPQMAAIKAMVDRIQGIHRSLVLIRK